MEKLCNEYNVDFALFMDRFYDFWLIVCITTNNRYDDKKIWTMHWFASRGVSEVSKKNGEGKSAYRCTYPCSELYYSMQF